MPTAFLAVFLVYPLGRVLARSGADPLALVSGETWRIAALAAGQAALSTGLALVIGLPIANVANRYRFRGRALVLALSTVPFVLPTVVVASRNDPVMTFPRARHWAATWGAELVDLGEAGHINAEAGFGHWAYGLAVLNRLAARAGLISSAD